MMSYQTIPSTDPINGLPPKDFKQKHIDKLIQTWNSILDSSYFQVNSESREWWDMFFKTTLPSSTSASEYIQTHEYHQPLNEWLSGKFEYTMPKEYLRQIKSANLINKVCLCIFSSIYISSLS